MRFFLALSLATVTLAGCSDRASEVRADELAAAIQQQQLEHFTRTFALEAPTRAIRYAESEAHTPTLRDLIEQGRLDFESDPELRELITLLYAERDYQPVFVRGARPTDDGRALSQTLLDAWSHGLDPAGYHADDLRHHLDVLDAAGDIAALQDQLELGIDDQHTLLAWMQSHAALDETLPAGEAVFRVLRDPGPDNPLPHFAEATHALIHTLERVAASGPELELRLASGYLRYARDQRYGNPWTLGREAAAAHDLDPAESVDEALVGELTRTRLGEAFRDAADDGFAAHLADLHPVGPQYEQLMAGVLEYTTYVTNGGWPQIETSRELEIGDRSDHVVTLRQRLAAENYFDGDLDDREFDRDLRSALRDYQRTHQLRETGTLSDETLSSLNVPAERRLAQIMVSMGRWREARSVVDHGGEYIFVNVSDFHSELWDEGELVYRWRVIVGRPRITHDDNGVEQVRGRTPLFSDTMLYLVFNPYWNVPQSIRREEYDHLIEENPKWLAMNNFELVPDDHGGDWLRQLPGPSNALGVVKFLFPNEHDVYMHDTPRRDLFAHNLRAFSHGCIRIQDPLEFARLLLMRDRGMDDRRVDEFIEEQYESGEEEWTTLRRPIPVHIEYYVVRGDDDGRMNFLADIYRYDRSLVSALEERLTDVLIAADSAAVLDEDITDGTETL